MDATLLNLSIKLSKIVIDELGNFRNHHMHLFLRNVIWRGDNDVITSLTVHSATTWIDKDVITRSLS